MKYSIGDLLVKRTGKSRILLITDVQFDMQDSQTGQEYYNLIMFDMSENSYNHYNSEHVATWLNTMYRHYPVKL